MAVTSGGTVGMVLGCLGDLCYQSWPILGTCFCSSVRIDVYIYCIYIYIYCAYMRAYAKKKYICLYVSMYISICICKRVQLKITKYTNHEFICIYIYMYIRIYIYIYCKYIYIYICICIYIYVYKIYVYLNVYRYMCICILIPATSNVCKIHAVSTFIAGGDLFCLRAIFGFSSFCMKLVLLGNGITLVDGLIEPNINLKQ